jgi:hypothetical protein
MPGAGDGHSHDLTPELDGDVKRGGFVQVLEDLRFPKKKTSAERMRALRECQRRGLRKLRIEVSEDDVRQIAKRGYEGAVTTDHDQQAQAVGLFLSDALLQI